MRDLNGEFGNQYRVGQLLPDHARALRARAEACITAAQALGEVSTRFEGNTKLMESLTEFLQEEEPRIAHNRAKIFTPIRR